MRPRRHRSVVPYRALANYAAPPGHPRTTPRSAIVWAVPGVLLLGGAAGNQIRVWHRELVAKERAAAGERAE